MYILISSYCNVCTYILIVMRCVNIIYSHEYVHVCVCMYFMIECPLNVHVVIKTGISIN